MYDDNEPKSSITCNGKQVAMKSVHVHGKLDGLLLRMKSRQTYTNESEDTLETVYTFPLAVGPYVVMSLIMLMAVFFMPGIATWLPGWIG